MYTKMSRGGVCPGGIMSVSPHSYLGTWNTVMEPHQEAIGPPPLSVSCKIVDDPPPSKVSVLKFTD